MNLRWSSALVLLLCACGDDEPNTPDLSAVVDLAAPPDLAPSADLLPARVARVNVIQYPSYAQLQVVPYGPSCGRMFSGTCEVVVCPSDTQGGYYAGEPRDLPGTISASSGGVTIVSDPPTYASVMGGPLTATAGQAVMVSATGGTIPAFSASLTMPAPRGTAAGTLQAGSTISRSQPYTLSFEPGAGSVLFSVSAGQSYLVCFFPGASGQGEVPSEALSLLPAGNASFGVYAADHVDVVAGGYGVQVRLVAPLVGDAGAPSGLLILQ